MRTPDVKALVQTHLRNHLLDTPVVSTRPDTNPPKQFVRIITAGGQGRRSRVLSQVSLIVDCYGESVGRAADLARRVDELLHDLPSSSVPVGRVEGGEPGEFPDPDRTDRPRYSATYQFTIRLI